MTVWGAGADLGRITLPLATARAELVEALACCAAALCAEEEQPFDRLRASGVGVQVEALRRQPFSPLRETLWSFRWRKARWAPACAGVTGALFLVSRLRVTLNSFQGPSGRKPPFVPGQGEGAALPGPRNGRGKSAMDPETSSG